MASSRRRGRKVVVGILLAAILLVGCTSSTTTGAPDASVPPDSPVAPDSAPAFDGASPPDDARTPDAASGVAFEDLPCKQIVGGEVCELDLPTSGSYQNPAWSPDSRYLLMTHFDGGYNSGAPSLEVLDLATGERTVVGEGVNLPGNSNTWNAGGMIVYAHEPSGDENVLTDADGTYVVDGEQGYVSSVFGDRTPSPITNHPDHAWEPALSPEGRWTDRDWVVFQDRYDARILITEVHPDYQVRRAQPHYDITDTRLSSVKQPVWSSDGRHIVYQGRTGGDWQLQIVDVPADPTVLAGAGSDHTRGFTLDGADPSFSPDGAWIVYSGGGTAEDTVHIVDLPATGTAPLHEPIKVTSQTRWYEGAPGWSSDGRLIAFESSPGNPESVGRTSIWIARAPAHP